MFMVVCQKVVVYNVLVYSLFDFQSPAGVLVITALFEIKLILKV